MSKPFYCCAPLEEHTTDCELLRDKDRLEWLLESHYMIVAGLTQYWLCEPEYQGCRIGDKHKSPREAIDAAIRESK